jgi:aminopeptidase N
MLIKSKIALCIFASFCFAPWLEAEVELGCRRSVFADEGEVAAKVRQFAPDRLIDVLHMKLDVTPDFRARRVAGETTLRFAPIARPLRELRLHAIDLEIASVEGSVPIAGYRVTGEELVVTFVEELPPGEEQWVTIAHAAEPEKGLYFRTPDMGYKPEDTHLWTQGESHEARHWYPSFDYPNERFTTEVICRVPEDMVVLSNGRKVGEEIDPETGLKSVRWLQDKPHVNYLVALMAGKFAKIEARSGEIPLGFYTPASQIQWAGNAFAPTADIMGFFEREIGVPYPWDQYNQVVVDDFTWGGMENTTLTVLADWALHIDETENVGTSEWLVAHELAHQWFGDYATCKDWTHLWLNEGFATYYENLYEGHRSGHDGLLYAMYRDARTVIGTGDRRPIAYREYEDPENQFDRRAYEKGSWVLHMLRAQLGDELYRKCIRVYLERNGLRSVVTEDLNRVLEELSGRSFDQFFDQWVYHGGLPKLEVEYSWNEVAKLAKVSVEQVQEVDDQVLLFRFPTGVRFEMEDGPVDREMAITKKRHDFYFPLEEQPHVVRFDPEYGLLAEVTFDKPKEMLCAQLAESDVIGRLRAVEALREKEDGKTVEALAAALSGDPFYGVRIEASGALREIHTPASFAALASAREQPDARVRRQVVRDVAGFYREESAVLLRETMAEEKNPAVLEEAIRGLGKYPGKETRKLLLNYLRSESFRNRLADAAIGAIRALDDPKYVEPLRKSLASREEAYTSRRFGEGLEALAYIARNREEKKGVRLFLSSYANHPKREIQRRAIAALGILRDPAAIPLVESFIGRGERKNRLEQAAKGALAKLRDARKVPVELSALREEVLQLKEESEKVREELEELKKKLEAEEER